MKRKREMYKLRRLETMLVALLTLSVATPAFALPKLAGDDELRRLKKQQGTGKLDRQVAKSQAAQGRQQRVDRIQKLPSAIRSSQNLMSSSASASLPKFTRGLNLHLNSLAGPRFASAFSSTAAGQNLTTSRALAPSLRQSFTRSVSLRTRVEPLTGTRAIRQLAAGGNLSQNRSVIRLAIQQAASRERMARQLGLQAGAGDLRAAIRRVATPAGSFSRMISVVPGMTRLPSNLIPAQPRVDLSVIHQSMIRQQEVTR